MIKKLVQRHNMNERSIFLQLNSVCLTVPSTARQLPGPNQQVKAHRVLQAALGEGSRGSWAVGGGGRGAQSQCYVGLKPRNGSLNLKILLRFIFNLNQTMTANTRDEHLYMAKITEQTERFEDMLDAMNKVVAANADLTVEERNLLSVAYKNTIGSRRTAWRALSSIEKKEEQKGSKNIGLLRGYKAKIEGELNKYCNEILNLIDNQLIPKASNSEARVFYYKMKGDYFRYISEYTSGAEHNKAGDNAHEAYKSATALAETDLKTTHPIRLGLALNYSVFHYEVKNDPSKACQLAKQAFDDAIADIDQIEEDQYKDATTIMQLIRDNLTLWTSELEEDGDK